MIKTKAIFEDTTMAYNRWTQGIASRELSTSKVGLSDLIKKQPKVDKAPKPLHPILAKTPETVGTIIVCLQNLKQKVDLALDSNLARNSKHKETLMFLKRKINRNLRFINSIIRDFESLS